MERFKRTLTARAIKKRIPRNSNPGKVPPVVHKYLGSIFRDESIARTHSIHSVSFQQEGKFCIKKKWLPFRADQTISVNPDNLGFVWSSWLHSWMPTLNICDAWLEGNAYLRASLGGAIPLVSDRTFRENNEELQVGEMLRWLAEAFLAPSVLLPESGIVTWKDVPDHPEQAMLSMVDPVTGKEAELKVTFTEDKLQIDGLRPAAEGNSFVLRRWVGWLSKYQWVEDMWIPTHMECGWINDETGNVELYFVGDNSTIRFNKGSLDDDYHDFHKPRPKTE
jgi:hypothetical protein